MHDFLKPVSKPDLLNAESTRIEEIRMSAGASATVFDVYYSPMLCRYAEYVQCLLLAPTVFAAFVASLATGVVILAENTRFYQRREHEDWEYHPLASRLSLYAWLARYPGAQFEWRPDTKPLPPTLCSAIAARFIEPGILSAFDPRVVSMIFSAVRPAPAQNRMETTLGRIVRLSSSAVLEHFENEYRKTWTDQGSHLAIPDHAADTALAERLAAAISRHPAPASGKPTPESVAFSQPNGATLEELMAAAPAPLREWFAELCESSDFEKQKKKIEFDEDGILVPVQIFVGFGLKSSDTLNLMRSAGWLIGRKDTRQLLHPALALCFKGELHAQL